MTDVRKKAVLELQNSAFNKYYNIEELAKNAAHMTKVEFLDFHSTGIQSVFKFTKEDMIDFHREATLEPEKTTVGLRLQDEFDDLYRLAMLNCQDDFTDPKCNPKSFRFKFDNSSLTEFYRTLRFSTPWS